MYCKWAFRVLICLTVLTGTTRCGLGSREAATPCTLTVASRPESGAKIFLNSQPMGETPHTFSNFPPGRVVVEVEKENYKRAWKTIDLLPGEETRVVLDMEPIVGYITVYSIPDGADVIVDGTEHLGTTPLREAKVPIGKHTLFVERKDYFPVQAEIGVEKDFRYNFSYELQPRPSKLRVYSRPTGAQIFLNFVEQDKRTPAEFDLEPGTYTVTVYANGYVMSERTIILESNAEQELMFVLEAGDAPMGMVLVPAGEFIVGVDGGSPDERPKRVVYLDAFYIDKYEVTNKQFKQVFPDHEYPADADYLPVLGVSWHQATAYAAAVGKRLPTELEWEKAARGVDGREFPWGNVFDAKLCNSAATPGAKPMIVGFFRAGASPYGCMDMAGNAYEWTSDWYQAYPGNKDIIKEYGQVFRVLRGGSFMTGAFDVRCARRYYDHMDAKRADYGFRCALSVKEGSRDARKR